jgi:hypothetical protein
MNAIELSKLTDKDLKAKTVEELKSIKRAAGQAYSTVGDHAKFNIVEDNWYGSRSYNSLEMAEAKAQGWIDIKEGR